MGWGSQKSDFGQAGNVDEGPGATTASEVLGSVVGILAALGFIGWLLTR
jgi:hypothetical protein